MMAQQVQQVVGKNGGQELLMMSVSQLKSLSLDVLITNDAIALGNGHQREYDLCTALPAQQA